MSPLQLRLQELKEAQERIEKSPLGKFFEEKSTRAAARADELMNESFHEDLK